MSQKIIEVDEFKGLFDEQILKSLERNRIISIKDFYQAKPGFILYLFKPKFKSVHEVQDFKRSLISRLAPPIESHCAVEPSYISTGSVHLDSALGKDGIRSGRLYEVYGPSGSGKTQLCMHLAVMTALKSGKNVLYFDTKNDFTVERLHQMTLAPSKTDVKRPKSAPKEAMTRLILKRIMVAKALDLETLLDYLFDIKEEGSESLNLSFLKDVSLLIIDNIASLFSPMLKDKNFKQISALINVVRSRLQWLAHHRNWSVVFTNNATRDRSANNTWRPSLGKLFDDVADTRLLILLQNANTARRKILVQRNRGVSDTHSSISVQIYDFGITDLNSDDDL